MSGAGSLRLQLLAWVLGPLAGLLAVDVWLAHDNAETMARVVLDNALLASAHGIAEQIRDNDGVVEAVIPPSALGGLATPSRDRVVYRVDGPTDELLAGYPDVPSPPASFWRDDAFWYDAMFRNLPVRVVAIAQPVSGNRDRVARVIVGETLAARTAMTAELWQRSLLHETALVGLAALFALIGLQRGLAPLIRLRDALRQRDPGSLERFDPASVQTELRPVVQAFNELMDRVERQMAQKLQFIADAAHQLRTPLALLRTQAAVGLRARDADGKDEALAGVEDTSASMSRVTNQLLTLARVEARSDAADAFGRVLLAPLLRSVLERHALRALDANISLSLDVPDAALAVRGDATMLGEMIANLVDNALHYTPVDGVIALRLVKDGGEVVIDVADSGPGIPVTERARVLERFYRAPGSAPDGSGLGLAIVVEIVARHHGAILLDQSRDHGGLLARVRLPVAPADDGKAGLT